MTHFTQRSANKNTQAKPAARRNLPQQNSAPRRKQQNNPREMHQKYILLAKEASSAGNHVEAEQFFQHAEHYYRLVFDRNSPEVAR